MAEPNHDLLLRVLEACARAAPGPLYPSTLATDVERAQLDEALDHLRLRGLVRLTEWVQGRGQGYAITAEGQAALHDPRLVSRPPSPQPPLKQELPEELETPWGRGEAVRSTLLRPTAPIVSMTLLVLNVLVFGSDLLLEWIRPGAASLLAWSRLSFPEVASGEWWRLASYMFVHGGFLHILLNMMALYSLGPVVETLWGSWRFLYLYLLTGIGAGCIAILLAPSQPIVGASGAICGLFASLAAWLLLNRRHFPAEFIAQQMRNVFFNVLMLVIISTLPRVSWQGHLGGAVLGVVAAPFLNNQRFGHGVARAFGWLGLLLLPVAVALVTYLEVLPQHARFIVIERLQPEFTTAEEKIAEVYNRYANKLFQNFPMAPKEPPLAEIRAGLAHMEEKLQATVEFLERNLPLGDAEADQAVEKGKEYLNGWAKFFNLLSKAIEPAPPWDANALDPVIAQRDRLKELREPLAPPALLQSKYGFTSEKK